MFSFFTKGIGGSLLNQMFGQMMQNYQKQAADSPQARWQAWASQIPANPMPLQQQSSPFAPAQQAVAWQPRPRPYNWWIR